MLQWGINGIEDDNMTVEYEWIIPEHDLYENVLPENYRLKKGVALKRYNNSGGWDYVDINWDHQLSIWTLSETFDFSDIKVPQRFHKEICLIQGLKYVKPTPVKKPVKPKVTMADDRKAFITKITKQCISEINKSKYELSFKVKIPNIGYCRGKRSWYRHYEKLIDISMVEPHHGMEYKRYRDDPIIGSIKEGSHNKLLAMTVAHEVAHYIHHMARLKKDKRITSLDNSSHGYAFRMIYRYLRETIVNPMD